MNDRPLHDEQTTAPQVNTEGEARIFRAMKWTAGTALVLAILIYIGLNVRRALNRPLPHSPFDTMPIVRPAYPPPHTSDLPKLKFTDITESAGLSVVVPNGATGEVLLPETAAGGCAVFDFEGDGDYDILLVGNAPWPPQSEQTRPLSLWLNNGKATFVDATESAGLNLTGHFMAAAAGDVNGDGAIDLFLSGVGDNRLLIQNAGRFEDATRDAGIRQTLDAAVLPNDSDETAATAGVTIPQPDTAWGTSCAFWDYDRDGDLDLVVANYVTWSQALDAALDCTTTGTKRGYCPPQAFAGSHPFLYRNDGDGRFTEVASTAGLIPRQIDTRELLGKSLSLAVCDLNADGWLDLLVANDSTQNDAYLNQQDGTFRSIGSESGWAYDSSGGVRRAFGIDIGWLADSQAWGVAVGTPTGEALGLYRAKPALMQFNDDASFIGFGPESHLPNSICPLWCDFDLDGRLDLFVANGGWDPDLVKLRWTQTPEQSASLYWNSGNDIFVPLGPDVIGDEFARPIAARSAAVADFDGDADPDVLIVSNGGAPRLLRNDRENANHWLRVEISDADAIGSRIEISVKGRRQQWVASPHRGYLGQSENAVTFGLAGAAEVDELIFHRSGGIVERRTAVAADQVLRLSGTQ